MIYHCRKSAETSLSYLKNVGILLFSPSRGIVSHSKRHNCVEIDIILLEPYLKFYMNEWHCYWKTELLTLHWKE